MADEASPSDPGSRSDAASPADSLQPRPGLLRRHWGKFTIAAIILMPVLIFTIWATVALSFSYSSGERVGFVQKLSLKGWVCKTWEGELQMSNIPGSAPILFQFSVRSDSLARVIEQAAGRQVALQYEQHIGVPTQCFGETEYYVIGVREVSRP